MREHIHFVTGKLAEHSLRAELARLAPQVGFDYSVDVLGITVAALLTTDWIAPRWQVPPQTSRIVLPGYCRGDLSGLARLAGVPVERGPRDLRRLPEFFGEQPLATDYGDYDIEILAEINHAPRLKLAEILAEASLLRSAGADVIDLGCEPGDCWLGVDQAVAALVAEGFRVSIDSMQVTEIERATRAGAELVLSVNASNRVAAPDWGCEVVVVPDDPAEIDSLYATVEQLASRDVSLRIDPILEPIGFGFAASLGRYLQARRRYPEAAMLMGIGNITELTDSDSAAINVMLLGFCQELGIRSVLTTQVINWARTSVQECDLARKLVHYAWRHRALPKRLEPRLVMLRDPSLLAYESDYFTRLARELKDPNYRLFADGQQLHAISAGRHHQDSDPFRLFEQIREAAPHPIDVSHAFYLGYELAKAATANTLGKEYRQDEALNWGFLTQMEQFHRLHRTARADLPGDPDSSQGTLT